MDTLTYGMQVPETGDKGAVFWEGLEENFTQLDSHNHNGTNSVRLTAAGMTPVSAAISAASWAAVSGKAGLLSQTISLPVGMTYDTQMLSFRSTGGDNLFLDSEKAGASSFIVYCNSNINVTAFYGV